MSSALLSSVPSAAEVVAESQNQEAAPAVQEQQQEGASTEASSEQQEATVDPAVTEQINTLANDVGLDPANFAGYADLASAEEAVRVWLDSKERRGSEYFGTANQLVNANEQNESAEEKEKAEYVPLDLAQLGLKEDDAAAKAYRALEKQVVESRQQLAQVIEYVKSNAKSAEQHRREAMFNEATQIVASWKSPKFGVLGQRTELQTAAVKQLYTLARKYELDSLAEGVEPAPLAIRLNQARFKLGDKPRGPIPPTAILPSTKSPQTPQEKGGASFTGAWSSDPQLQAKLRAIR